MFMTVLLQAVAGAGLANVGAALAASIVVRHFGCATTTIDVLKSTLEKLDFGGIDA